MRTPIMSCCRLMAAVLFLFCSMPLFAQRQDILLNDNWKFRFSHQVQKGSEIRVDLPHTWNAQDALSGKIDYKRGIGNYEKKLFIRPEWQGKRLFLRFEGVNSIADVFINRRHIGEHRGGYGAFVFEITGEVNYGKENSILVRVNNGEQLDVMPLVGDFNFYGGIYRDVHLLITDEACISPLNYASPGVRLIQDSVSHQYAKVRAVVDLANGNNAGQEVELGVRLLDGQKVVAQQKQTLTLAGNAALQQELTFEINNPHLWNGRQDPFLYQAEVSLSRGGQLVDCVTQPLGLRYYRIDPDKGFFLNGKHLPLHGVCRHQDRSEVGNALRPQHHEEDVALMLEMGVNAVRLAHYPQNEYTVRLAEKMGFILWQEIPVWQGIDFTNNNTRKKAQRMLSEMIKRDQNRCAVGYWGIANETQPSKARNEFLTSLLETGKQLDTTRLYVAAFDLVRFNREKKRFVMEDSFTSQLDVVAVNKYMGWYHPWPIEPENAVWEVIPDKPLIISEFGGEALYGQSGDENVASSWSEEYQARLYRDNIRMFDNIPNLRGVSPWILFDFRSPFRFHPTNQDGWNRKGLVSDQGIRKKAWYLMREYYKTKFGE